ncbi:uncharacterized protein N7482_001189 [Penicillium canariense]|uniref:S-adenosyl-L-methionine-dependent methyltransferase n=1 Tax=Penicillium canariense TaxID=189055 RepID=A0A9W9IF65_9EURO|nr:uncharacterized protein N7482_001189 [Penicillium canariense]KAJ5175312.1 hypothetical protein N7482_001189 [Penicillium canariense]
MTQTNPPQPSGGGRLLNTFINRPIGNHGAGWSSLWDSGESDLWDRGKASPALVDIIEQERVLLSPFTSDGRRKKALVPGCGRGYDVVMLALHGFDAFGLEISETAIKEAEIYASAELAKPSDYHFGSGQHQPLTTGSVTFFQGDFFTPQWNFKAGIDETTQFDVVYDYTFLCALHPEQRKEWASGMARVLKSGGLLICLEFPLYKDPKLPGPPWGLKGVHWNLLAEGGKGMITGPVGADGKEQKTASSDLGDFNRVLYVTPARSYDVAKGTDMVSVYVRK